MGWPIKAWRVKLLPIGDPAAQYNESTRPHSLPDRSRGMSRSAASLDAEAKCVTEHSQHLPDDGTFLQWLLGSRRLELQPDKPGERPR